MCWKCCWKAKRKLLFVRTVDLDIMEEIKILRIFPSMNWGNDKLSEDLWN